MLKKLLAIVGGAALIANFVCVSSMGAQTKAASIDEVKAKIARLAAGPRALVSVKLRDNRRLEGWVSAVAADHFILTESNTRARTPVTYADVSEVKSLRPSKALWVAVTTAVLAGAALIFLFAGAKH